MKAKENSYVTVKVAASELGVSRGQIRDLISKKLIDYKLENGVYVVDLNSIDYLILDSMKN